MFSCIFFLLRKYRYSKARRRIVLKVSIKVAKINDIIDNLWYLFFIKINPAQINIIKNSWEDKVLALKINIGDVIKNKKNNSLNFLVIGRYNETKYNTKIKVIAKINGKACKITSGNNKVIDNGAYWKFLHPRFLASLR